MRSRTARGSSHVGWVPLRRLAVIGAALIGEDGVRDVTTAVDIGSKSWPFDIRLRPWAFRPPTGLLPRRFYCATSPVVAGATRIRRWPLSRVFVGFNRQYVRSGHYGEVWNFFAARGSSSRIASRDPWRPQSGPSRSVRCYGSPIGVNSFWAGRVRRPNRASPRPRMLPEI